MGTLPLDAYLEAHKKLVDKTLLKLLKTSGNYRRFPTLDKSLKHTIFLKGKRLRPIMVLMTYELFGGTATEVADTACAIELVHAGSLMLDDLPSMDDAEYRRGKKTNHVLFGDATTILASAALWVESFHILAGTSEAAPLIEATTKYIGKDGLVLGQYMDLFAFNKQQSLKDLRQCYELKTGSLFMLAATYGAILGGANNQEQKSLEDFARAFGIAYQIRDDIIDATETEQQSGKDAHKDEQNNKPNYVTVLGLIGAQKALKKELATATKALAGLGKDTMRLEQLLNAMVVLKP